MGAETDIPLVRAASTADEDREIGAGVLRLRRGRQSYLRHLEFEMRHKKGLELRCFEYATRLPAQFQMPVLTTVVLAEKSGPRELVYREVLGRRVVHERRFDAVRLWEMDPERALRLGPGAAALVGASEKASLPLVERAARLIARETKALVRADLLFILQAFSRGRWAGESAGRRGSSPATGKSVRGGGLGWSCPV